MASYLYWCDDCGDWEIQRPIGTAERESTCPTCGATGRRLYTAPLLSRTPQATAGARMLEEASRDPQGLVSFAAKDALKAIAARASQPVTSGTPDARTTDESLGAGTRTVGDLAVTDSSRSTVDILDRGPRTQRPGDHTRLMPRLGACRCRVRGRKPAALFQLDPARFKLGKRQSESFGHARRRHVATFRNASGAGHLFFTRPYCDRVATRLRTTTRRAHRVESQPGRALVDICPMRQAADSQRRHRIVPAEI